MYHIYKQVQAFSGCLQDKYGDKIEKILYGPEEDGYAVGSLKDKKKPIIFRQAPDSLLLSPAWQTVIGMLCVESWRARLLAFGLQPWASLATEAAMTSYASPCRQLDKTSPCLLTLSGSGWGHCWLLQTP